MVQVNSRSFDSEKRLPSESFHPLKMTVLKRCEKSRVKEQPISMCSTLDKVPGSAIVSVVARSDLRSGQNEHGILRQGIAAVGWGDGA
jgi:hypothetical protein